MLRLKDGKVKFPERYPKIERKIPTVEEKGWVKVNGVILRENIDLIPQVGFQETMGICNVNVLFTGGSASAGKTYAVLLEAMRGLGRYGYSAIIVKKELVEAKAGGGMLADAKRIYSDMVGCMYTSSDSPTFEFPHWSSTIQLTHMNLQGSSQEREAQEKMKNKSASYIAIDETTNFTFKIWKYWFSRNRDNSGMSPRMICTLNSNGWHWTRRMLDWYIGSDNYVIPERVGVLRYFVIQGEGVEDIIWGDSVEEVVRKANITVTPEMKVAGVKPENMVKSFTFIPGNLMDNRILTHSMKGENVANLYQLGEAERMKLMMGFWGEMEEGEAQVSRSQIRDLFTNPVSGSKEKFMTVDLGDGGDASKAWIWIGNTAIKIKTSYSSDAKEKVAWVRALQIEYGVPIKNTAVDATGIGNYFDDYLKGCVGIVMNRMPINEYDEDGNLLKFEQYCLLRDQLMGKLCAMIDSQELSIAIDPDKVFEYGKEGKKKSNILDILMDQAECLKRLRKDNGKYFFVSKLAFKKSRGYSPDDLDNMIMKMIFNLDVSLKKEVEVELTEADYVLW